MEDHLGDGKYGGIILNKGFLQPTFLFMNNMFASLISNQKI